MKQHAFAALAGFVQFEPRTRTANGEQVRDLVVKPIGSQQSVTITLWSKHEQVQVERGDFVIAEGRLRVRQVETGGEAREYRDLDAARIIRLEPEPLAAATARPVADDQPPW